MLSRPTRIKVRDPGALIAIVPHLLGFHPERSLVIVGLKGSNGRVRATFRLDLPDPPSRSLADDIALQLAVVLARHRLDIAAVLGYGTGTVVSPVVDAVTDVLPRAGIALHGVLRVHEGRYWSYAGSDVACCPPEGTPVPDDSHPAAQALTSAGSRVAESRAAFAATVAPVTGIQAAASADANLRAEIAASDGLASLGAAALRAIGQKLVQDAIAVYRDKDRADQLQLARIAVAVADLEVRDDAWARMIPKHAASHLQLWTDVTRIAQPGRVAAPASLLAFVAWQSGNGILANLAVDRALDDDPEYSMARLMREVLSAGLPPSSALLPTTSEEAAVRYLTQRVTR